MADIYEDLGTIMALAEAHDSGRLFTFGRERCLALAGESVTESLAAFDMADYVASLATVARLAVTKAQEARAPAVYFEYDLDNGWSSNFFICGTYNAIDSDWASDWQDHVPGPSMPAFAAQYDSRFGDDPASQGRTVLLVARTMAAIIDATASWPEHLILAAAYHDQDQVTTIRRPKP
jgi:hypothetical protein